MSIVCSGLLVLGVAAAAGAYFYARRSLPQTSGMIQVAGLAAPVDIVRDASAHRFRADAPPPGSDTSNPASGGGSVCGGAAG